MPTPTPGPVASAQISVALADLIKACNALHTGQGSKEAAERIEASMISAGVAYARPTTAAKSEQYALVVLSEGGVMDMYQTGPGPTITDTIDCQNGLAGDIFSLSAEFTPVLLQAFGAQSQWPPYVRIAADDDVDVEVVVANPEGRVLSLTGIYSAARRELTLGGMNASDGYKPSFALIQSISFDDQSEPLYARQDMSLWDYTPHADAVIRLDLPRPLEEMLCPSGENEAPAART